MLTNNYKDKIIILLTWSSFNPEGLCGEVEKKKYNTSGGLIDILPIPLISDQTFFNFMAFCLKIWQNIQLPIWHLAVNGEYYIRRLEPW